jgi:hypothetical protein
MVLFLNLVIAFQGLANSFKKPFLQVSLLGWGVDFKGQERGGYGTERSSGRSLE